MLLNNLNITNSRILNSLFTKMSITEGFNFLPFKIRKLPEKGQILINIPHNKLKM